jgi:hypothetical protein
MNNKISYIFLITITFILFTLSSVIPFDQFNNYMLMNIILNYLTNINQY